MGRIIVVGDRFQSCYGFRGADISAMSNLQKMLEARPNGCKVFPLSVCRRSPKSHIRLAQALVPDIKWCMKERDGVEAPEGEIYQVNIDVATEMMKEGDIGLSRVNRVLIPVAYRCIKLKKKVIIRGKDIGKGLISLIKSLSPVSIEDLLFKINQYEAKEFKKLLVSESLAAEDDSAPQIHADTIARMSKKNQTKLEIVLDKTGCVVALCDGVDSLSKLIKNIEDIFAEFDDDGKPKDAIVLGTCHRTKGLEAYNVYMIDPENFPHPMATKEWEVEQERNLVYIGVTRAKFKLDKDGSILEPGRLIFVGTCPPILRADWLMGQSVYPEPTTKNEQTMRQRLVAFYIKHQTPKEVAEKMVEQMSEAHVEQCAMVMSI